MFTLKNPFIKILTFLLLWPLVPSCSTMYHQPETIAEKMERFKDETQQKKNIPLDFAFFDLNYAQGKKDRIQRKLASKKVKKEIGKGNPFYQASNRQIYFLTLAHQYFQLEAFLGVYDNQFKECPRFHSQLLEFPPYESDQESLKKVIANNSFTPKSNFFEDQSQFSLYPELFLPLSWESSHPNVFDQVRSDQSKRPELIYEGLQIHLAKTRNELEELCEYGKGPNYYIFENLITHNQSHKDFKRSKKALQIMMKTTVVANMALITSLNLNYPIVKNSSTRDYKHLKSMVLHRLNASWIKIYFSELKRRRKIFAMK